MKDRTALLLSAVVFAVCILGASSLARTPSSLGHALAAVLVAGGVLTAAALTPARAYSRPALLGAGAILAACTALPLLLVADTGAWLRQTPAILGYFWLWLMILGMPSPGARRFCASPRILLLSAAALGAGTVVATLW